MIFTKTYLQGAYVLDINRIEDDRGFFARAWCRREFEEHGLNPNVVQTNIGYSKMKGTIRGMHFQAPPWGEVKVVRCTAGAIYDVVVDLRADSPTHKRWIGIELTESNRRMLYVPEGFAHGYETLTDDAEICYQTTQFYQSRFSCGVRYDDKAFNILWPLPAGIMSEQDRSWPDYLL